MFLVPNFECEKHPFRIWRWCQSHVYAVGSCREEELQDTVCVILRHCDVLLKVPMFIAQCEVFVKFRFLTVCQTNCLIRNEALDWKAENLIMDDIQGHRKFRRVGERCEWSNRGFRVAWESRRNL
jgi:hypothetical protein